MANPAAGENKITEDSGDVSGIKPVVYFTPLTIEATWYDKTGRVKKKKKPIPGQDIKIIERRKRVFELRKQGHHFYKIAEILKEEGFTEHSIGTVNIDFREAIKERKAELALSVDEYLELELAKLDDMDVVIQERVTVSATKDDVKSTLDIMKQRDRLMGISKEQRANINLKNTLASLMGVDPAELPDSQPKKRTLELE